MKIYKFIFLLFWSIAACQLSAKDGNIRAFLEPATVSEGESFAVVVENQGRDNVELLQGIGNFRYVGSSQSMNYSSGEGHRTRVEYTFIAPAAGKYTVGPLKARAGSRELTLPAMTLTVVKSPDLPDKSSGIFERSSFGGDRRTFYINEDIPLSIGLFWENTLNIDIDHYPEIDIGKSVFCDFRSKNRHNSKFDQPRVARLVIDDKLYQKITFRTAFRALAPGRLQVTGSIPYSIIQAPPRQRRSDFFFGSYRRIDRAIQIKLPEITIKPLPPAPADGYNLNLVGQFQGTAKLSQTQVKALELLTLELQITGSGSWETLKVPELSLGSCRVYPGEVTRKGNGCSIKYAFIPLKAGNMDLDLNFYSFDPVKAEYRAIKLNTLLKVTAAAPGSTVPGNSSEQPEAVAPTLQDAHKEQQSRTTLLYCKKAPSSKIKQFYRRNRIELAVLLAVSGVIWLLAGSIRHRFRKRSNNYTDQRRKRAGSLRDKLYKQVRDAKASELSELVSGEVADYLCDRWQLPAGSTIDDIARSAQDKDLAEVLQECANSSYLPEELAQNALKDPERTRKVLLRTLKILLLGSMLFMLPEAAAAVKQELHSWRQALEAYDRGNYKTAHDYFEKYAADNPADANVYYNLGCTAAADDQMSMALYYFECAGLMAPGDPEIYENRNVMRRKFFHPETDHAGNPWMWFRKTLAKIHPEDYLVIAGLLIFIACVVMSMRTALSKAWRWGVAAAAVGTVVLISVTVISLYNNEYSGNRALVVSKDALLYNYPGSTQTSQDAALGAGTFVKVIEKRHEYSLIRSNDREGWVKNKSIKLLKQ